MTRTEDGETITYTLGVDDQLATYGRAASPLAADGGSYTYNAAGCVTRIERDGRPALDLTWNGQYQLVSVSTNGVFAESYAYDALGRRVSTTTQEGTVRHVYDDSWQCLADIDENGNVLRSYVWGEGIDKLLAISIGGNVYYPLTDIQGTVWGYADSANNVVACWMYDAWGNVLSEYCAVPTLASVRYRFQGRERSATTGLTNFRMRWYDAETGRWLSKDPVGLNGGINSYVFCENSPISFIDPIGFNPSKDALTFAKKILGLAIGIIIKGNGGGKTNINAINSLQTLIILVTMTMLFLLGYLEQPHQELLIGIMGRESRLDLKEHQSLSQAILQQMGGMWALFLVIKQLYQQLLRMVSLRMIGVSEKQVLRATRIEHDSTHMRNDRYVLQKT